MSFLAADTPWSPGGEVTGTVTFKYIENCYYEGQLQADGPGGEYTAKIQLLYHELARFLVWIETDSRGFTVVKAGDILGMGGQLTWRWESLPFTYKGQVIRMAGTLFTSAPDAPEHHDVGGWGQSAPRQSAARKSRDAGARRQAGAHRQAGARRQVGRTARTNNRAEPREGRPFFSPDCQRVALAASRMWYSETPTMYRPLPS
jgi:hypothetical protein